MNSRIKGLSDGVFAIVMTLLVIEIKVPEIHGAISNAGLWHALIELSDLFLTYALSFLVLFTYWLFHSFVFSLAKNVNRTLLFLNFPFLLSAGLIPFSSHLIGSYPGVQVAIWVYSANIIFIGISSVAILHYIQKSEEIQNHPIKNINLHYGYIRALFPVVASVITILLSFINTRLSLVVLAATIFIAVVPGMIRRVDHEIINRIWPHKH